MKNLQDWIDFKANCNMVLQHISSMSFGVGEDKITIQYNDLSGEYKSKDLPKRQKELLQKSIEKSFDSDFDATKVRDLIKQKVFDVLKDKAKEYVDILDDLKQFTTN